MMLSCLKTIAATTIALAALSLAAAEVSRVFEAEAEFIAYGDFDGDGDDDVAIIDRASGQLRFGERNNSSINWENYTFSNQETGINNVSSVAVGNFTSDSYDSLALTSVSANRVHIVSTRNNVLPKTLSNAGLGPRLVVATDIAGNDNTPFPDLAVFSTENPQEPTNAWHLFRNSDGTNFSKVFETDEKPIICTAATAFDHASGENLVAMLQPIDENSAQLITVYLDADSGMKVLETAANTIPPGSKFVHASFSNDDKTQFVTYSADTLICFTSSLAGLNLAGELSLGKSIRQLFIFRQKKLDWEKDKVDRYQIAVVYTDGTGTILEFNGVDKPTLLQNLSPSSGKGITAVVGFDYDSGRIHLLEGKDGVSDRVSVFGYDWQSGTYQSQNKILGIRELKTESSSNTLLFANEPFVHPTPIQVARYAKGDWSTELFGLTNSSPTLNVTSAVDEGEADGLKWPGTYNLGTPPPEAKFFLINQIRGDTSMYCLNTPVGTVPLDVKITPEPGTYDTAIQLNFELSVPSENTDIYYRMVGAEDPSWKMYDQNLASSGEFSPGMFVNSNLTIQYYATNNSDNTSPIRQAVYTFTTPPFKMDSDGDGIPDFVELQYGFDPTNSGTDENNNGINDLCEILGENLSSILSFNLVAEPLSHSGEEKTAYIPAMKETPVSAYTSTGTSLARALTVIDENERSTALLEKLVLQPGGLILVATEDEFSTINDGLVRDSGRALVALVPPNKLKRPELDYVYSEGTLEEEVDAWIAEARDKWGEGSNPLRSFSRTLTPIDSLATLIYERMLHQCFVERGRKTEEDSLTLLPFYRGDDPESYRVTPADLRNLAQLSEKSPAYDLEELFEKITGTLGDEGVSGITSLRKLTNEIYRIHGYNVLDVMRQPIFVVREFIATGEIAEKIVAKSNLTDAEVQEARLGVANLLALRTGREIIVRTAKITNTTFAGDLPLVEGLGRAAGQFSLVNAFGEAGLAASNIELLPGVVIEIYGYLLKTEDDIDTIEVIAVEIISLPQETDNTDSDGDGLADSWEFLFFGSLAPEKDGDEDGDGDSNLTEFLNGTDPADKTSKSPVGLPSLLAADGLYRPGHQQVTFSFTLPEYDTNLGYDIEVAESTAFETMVTDLTSASYTSGEVNLSFPAFIPSGTYYWRVRAFDQEGAKGSWNVASQPLLVNYCIALESSWNLVSSPVNTNETVAEIFPTAILPLWAWNPQLLCYQAVGGEQTLQGGVAYWVLVPNAVYSEPFTGTVPNPPRPLLPGWNLLGHCPENLWETENLILEYAWGWENDAYLPLPLEDLLDTPEWFKGYWLH